MIGEINDMQAFSEFLQTALNKMAIIIRFQRDFRSKARSFHQVQIIPILELAHNPRLILDHL